MVEAGVLRTAGAGEISCLLVRETCETKYYDSHEPLILNERNSQILLARITISCIYVIINFAF